jgi:hypothetical protein
MAAIGINFALRDAKGATSIHTVNLADTVSLDNVVAFVEEFYEILDDLTGCAIDGATLSISVPPAVGNSIKATPVANSDVEEGATFIYVTEGGYTTRARVPGFLETLIVAGSQSVDQDAAAVLAYLAAVVGGLSVGTPAVTVEPTDYRGDDIQSLKTARESFTKTRALR